MFKNLGLQKIFPYITLIALLASYALLLTHPINLVTADLGRHIKNGEIILSSLSFEKTNTYSYTYPEYPTINHHWLSGVVFYLVWKYSGFIGIHILFIAISLVAFLLFILIGTKKSSLSFACLMGFMLLPIIQERNEIRPEAFSYLLAGIFLWLMLGFKDGKTSYKKLFLIPFLQLIWVNTHIYFFVGLVIVGAFLFEAIILKHKENTKKIGLIFLLSILAIFINPYGIHGALAPFTIFTNFGYQLAENQSVWFIENILPSPLYLIFKIIFGLLAISFVLNYTINKTKINIVNLIFATGFSLAAWFVVRNFAIFGLFALPILCTNIGNGYKETLKKSAVIIFVSLLILISLYSGELNSLYPYSTDFSFGAEKNNEIAGKFINENITGPVFNNYDIGGYLIFYLYSKEKVFVDNRPEAYPANFFEKTLIPMQENEKIWQEKLKKYSFKSIIFSYRDYTPWGQAFLVNRLKDPTWKTVFKDDRVIIFSRI